MNISILNNAPISRTLPDAQLAFPTTWAPDPYAHFETVLTAKVVKQLDELPALPTNWKRSHLRLWDGVVHRLDYSERALLRALGRSVYTLKSVREHLGCVRKQGHHTTCDKEGQGGFALAAAVQIARGAPTVPVARPTPSAQKAPDKPEASTQERWGAGRKAACLSHVLVPEAAAEPEVRQTVRCTIDAQLFGAVVTISVQTREDIARVAKLLEAAL